MFSNSRNSPLIQRTIIDVDPIVVNGRNNHHQRPSSEFSNLFRDIFHRTPRSKLTQTEKEMTTLSTTLIKSSETTETLASHTGNIHKEDLCLFSDSPHYIVRV